MLHQSAASTPSDQPSILTSISHILTAELSGLNYLTQHVPQEAETLVKKILNTSGKIILSGIGKSGLIARKLAATFSGTGTPALFIHPTEALHGDLGTIQPQDLFIIFSKSASGEEFEKIISFLHYQGNDNILICCNPGPLTSYVNLTIQLPIETEACFLNLAPTTSSTIMMAFGDAIALTAAQQRGFTKQDFARLHPSGSLGKKLLLTVTHIMHHGESLPLISPNDVFSEILTPITQKKLGVGIVVDSNQQLLGIITDGDLRRACNEGIDVFKKTALEIMTPNPKSIHPNKLAKEALELMEYHNITTLIVTLENKVIGILHIHDLVKAGLRG